MTRRTWIVWMLLLAVVAVGGTYCVLWLTAPTPGFTEENARLLRRGMTLSQVEELFGASGIAFQFLEPPQPAEPYYIWMSDSGPWVHVVFDQAGHLKSAGFGSSEINVNESFLDWLRRMLRL